MPFHLPAIRRQFPILSRQIDGHPLIYLNNAATAQKPEAVLEAMDRFYRHSNGNAHRGMHVLAEEATIAFEDARNAVARFIGARRPEEIIFTKSCTEAINLVARSFGESLKSGDAIALSILEHHSNVVPWLQLKERDGIEILWLDCDAEGRLHPEELRHILDRGRVKLLSITAQSNVLGIRPPLAEMIALAHAAGMLVMVDAAQAIAHGHIDVRALDCDFLAFSGHKLYGPTGIGVLYGKQKLLEAMPPFLGGGMMIHEVHRDHFTAADIPAKFEAGTQPIAEAVGLHAAINWFTQFDWNDIVNHEQELLTHAASALNDIPGLHVLGPLSIRHLPLAIRHSASGCLSFTIDGVHPHDLTEILGRKGICLRAGHHCTQPLHKRLGIAASTRLSVGIYNTKEEIDATVEAIGEIVSHFTR
ncbi:SufS family cysteine desulfurase [Candidatus Peregrinibacteria bacterium]|nr:SufS family cysteine desulfurase [Candidatus Peregrinibacteria bacterium]